MKTNELINLKNKKGFIDLNLAKFCEIERIHFASNATHHIRLNDGGIIFKHYYDEEQDPRSMGAFNEVFYYLLSKKYNLRCAKYDLALYETKYGTISYCLENDNQNSTFVSLYQHMDEYTKSNNYFDFEYKFMHVKYLMNFFKKQHKKHSHLLIDELLHMITFDTLLLHRDKGATNIMFETNNKTNEVHLWSIDSSHLWGGFGISEKRFDEYAQFYRTLTLGQQKKLLNFIDGIEIADIIDTLKTDYPNYDFIFNEIRAAFDENKKELLCSINKTTILKKVKVKFYLSEYYKVSKIYTRKNKAQLYYYINDNLDEEIETVQDIE